MNTHGRHCFIFYVENVKIGGVTQELYKKEKTEKGQRKPLLIPALIVCLVGMVLGAVTVAILYFLNMPEGAPEELAGAAPARAVGERAGCARKLLADCEPEDCPEAPCRTGPGTSTGTGAGASGPRRSGACGRRRRRRG